MASAATQLVSRKPHPASLRRQAATEVYALYQKGLTGREIAQRLRISKATTFRLIHALHPRPLQARFSGSLEKFLLQHEEMRMVPRIALRSQLGNAVKPSHLGWEL